jgi:hypothetical protein
MLLRSDISYPHCQLNYFYGKDLNKLHFDDSVWSNVYNKTKHNVSVSRLVLAIRRLSEENGREIRPTVKFVSINLSNQTNWTVYSWVVKCKQIVNRYWIWKSRQRYESNYISRYTETHSNMIEITHSHTHIYIYIYIWVHDDFILFPQYIITIKGNLFSIY